MGAPCVRCDERRVGCHAECERYLSWSAEHRAARETEYKKQIVKHYKNERSMRLRRWKMRRKKRGRKG